MDLSADADDVLVIQRGNLKYIRYLGVWDVEELYDVAKDPNEMDNLINDPAFLKTKMILRHRCIRTGQSVEHPTIQTE